MATVGDVIQSGQIVSKYVSASIDFSAAANGSTSYGTTTWDEPRSVMGVQLHCLRTVALANGTNTKLLLEVKLSPTLDQWAPMIRGIANNADTDAAFNGWTWVQANGVCEKGLVCQWTNVAGSDVCPVNIYGMQLTVVRDAGDATLAGTITGVWLSTVPWSN